MKHHPAAPLRTCITLAVILLAMLASQPGAALAQGQTPPSVRFDLTDNNVINGADAADLIGSWHTLQNMGQCLTPALASRDVDGSGCVDVADVQLVLAHWGELVDPSRPRASAGPLDSAITLTVNDRGDATDTTRGDGVCATSQGTCTLRAAAQEASSLPGAKVIAFDIRNSDGSCPSLVTIQSYSPVWLDDGGSGGITIDGYTQCGAAPNTQAIGDNAGIRIELKGYSQNGVNGLNIRSSNNVVRGMAIYNHDHEIEILGAGALNNRIEGNFIGTNAANSFMAWPIPGPNKQSAEGVFIGYGPTDTIIGGTAPEARNIISGNGHYGVDLWGDVYRSHVIGNYIGLKKDGRTALRNYSKGVDMNVGPQYNWVGGTNPGEGNVISGNRLGGMEISHGTNTQYNSIVGNYFGLDASGTRAVPNEDYAGFSFEDTVDSNEAYNNVISGNGGNGIFFYVLASNNDIHHNLIGVLPDGVTAMPNGRNTNTVEGRNGIVLWGGSHNNHIHDNVIANNPDNGVYLTNRSDENHNGIGTTYYNTISRNTIYKNNLSGIYLDSKVDPSTGAMTYANEGLPAPRLFGATTTLVAGAASTRAGGACGGCRIEVFIADKTTPNDPSGDNHGQGKTFIGEGTTDAAGNFAVTIAGAQVGQVITATSTDANGNTSQFGRNIAVGESPIETPTPAPTLTPTAGPTETPSPTETPTVTPAPAPPNYPVWLPAVVKSS